MADPKIFSNLDIFAEIAQSAFGEMNRCLNLHREKRVDGGYILKPDPERTSFKQGLIAITFTAAFVEVYLRLVYVFKFRKSPSMKWDFQTYEDKLKSLGVYDQELLSDSKNFRCARNDVLHEKPIVVGESTSQMSGTAQDAAAVGISLIRKLQVALPLGADHDDSPDN